LCKEKVKDLAVQLRSYSIMDIAKWIEPVEYNKRLSLSLLTPENHGITPLA
jgi:hypothetical protein